MMGSGLGLELGQQQQQGLQGSEAQRSYSTTIDEEG